MEHTDANTTYTQATVVARVLGCIYHNAFSKATRGKREDV